MGTKHREVARETQPPDHEEPGSLPTAPAPCLSHQAPAHPLVPESLTPHRRVSSNVQEGQVQPPLLRYVETALLMTRKPSTLSLLASACPPFLWGNSKGMWSLAKLVQRRKRDRASPRGHKRGQLGTSLDWSSHHFWSELSIQPGLGRNVSLLPRQR